MTTCAIRYICPCGCKMMAAGCSVHHCHNDDCEGKIQITDEGDGFTARYYMDQMQIGKRRYDEETAATQIPSINAREEQKAHIESKRMTTTGVRPAAGRMSAQDYSVPLDDFEGDTDAYTATETVEDRYSDDDGDEDDDGDTQVCDVSGCKKEAIADLLSEEDGLRCLGCLEWWLRENQW